MVNATQMAKPFGKRVRQWSDNPGTRDYIDVLAKHKGMLPIAQKRLNSQLSRGATISLDTIH